MGDVQTMTMDFGHHLQSVPLDALTSSQAMRLSSSQLCELQLAMQRSVKSKSGRKKLEGATGVLEEEQVVPVVLGAKRRHTDGAGKAGEQSDSDDDFEFDLSKLTAEEQASLLAVEGQPGGSKDARKLKRLLRNRMSAQQARERKKMYVVNLEEQAKAQLQQMSELQSRLQLMESHNSTLRCIIRTMPRDSAEDTAPQAN